MSLPTHIGRFRIEGLLGQGGMGQVYRAYDPKLKRYVALKTLKPGDERRDLLERLYREAQACAALQHANIVTVYDVDEIDGLVYIAMELLEGAHLDHVIRRGELTFRAACDVLWQVVRAVQHAHEHGVIHRDIKPSNVFRLPDGSIKLLDFGIARLSTEGTLTLPGTFFGTLHYCSPEQLRGEPVDQRSDVYSLGALAYELLSGRRPFAGESDSAAAVMSRALYEQPESLSTAWTRRFPQIRQVVERAMAKAPRDRYQSAQEMRAALETFITTHAEAIEQAQQESGAAAAAVTEINAPNIPVVIAAPPVVDTQAPSITRRIERAQPVAAPVPEAARASELVAPPKPVPGPESVVARPSETWHTSHLGTVADKRGGGWLWPIGVVAASIAIAAALWLLTKTNSNDAANTRAATPPAAAGTPAGGVTPPAPSALAPESSRPTSESQPAANPPAVTPAANGERPAKADNGKQQSADGTRPTSTSTATATVPAASAPVASSGPSAPPVDTPPPSAKDLFASAANDGSVNPGLRYRVIQRSSNGRGRDVDPDTLFRAGDGIRFAFESNVDGYLYVIYVGSSGRGDVLFPSPDINGGRNAVKRGQEYIVSDEGWFDFDDTPGEELLFVILSREPVVQFPGVTPLLKAETLSAAVVQQVEQSIRPRDLIFHKDRSSARADAQSVSYVVNPDQLGKSVTAIIRLRHAK